MSQAIVPISYYNITKLNIYMEGSEKLTSLNLCLKATLDVLSGVAFFVKKYYFIAQMCFTIHKNMIL